MTDGPVTLEEIYSFIIDDIGGDAAGDSTLGALLLALGAAIKAGQGGGGSFPDFTGSGSPEGVQVANAGQWYEDKAADSNGLYVLEGNDGTNTGWMQVGGVHTGPFVQGLASDGSTMRLLCVTGQNIILQDVADTFSWVLSGTDGSTDFPGVIFPIQAPTADAPAYVEGGMYYDSTLGKLRVGGASGWETVTSA